MLPALLLAADLAGTFAVSDRTELRMRAPGTPPETASVDAETALDAEVTLASKRWAASRAYTPRFTLWDLGDPAFSPTELQAGRAHLEWKAKHARLWVDETASYGSAGFASSSLAPGMSLTPPMEGKLPQVEGIPTAPYIDYMSSNTTLASHVDLRRWTLDMSVGYQLAGGASAAARALLPLQSGPFAEVTADYAAGRREHVVTKLTGSELTFSSGPESILVELDEGWRHLWTRLVETRLSVGVAEARQSASPGAAAGFATYPVVEATFARHGVADSLDVAAEGRLGPVVNRLDGLVEQRVQGTLTATHRHRRLTTRLFASAAQTVPGDEQNATSLFASELDVAYDANQFVSFDTGGRLIWQRIVGTGVPFLQGTLFAGVTLRAPRVRW